jgi:guanylate kinase
VVQWLQRELPQLVRSISVTTRLPRRGEQPGKDYHFVSPGAFGQLKRAGRLLEWASVHGACYGTPARPILRALSHGHDVLLNIDVQGARQVRRALGSRAVLIFLVPPSLGELRQRLTRRRTETAAALQRRLVAARRELACATWYDYRVINDRLEQAVRDIKAIIVARQGKQRRGLAHGARPD